MVYVVQEVPRRNITAAAKYGELVVLLPQGDIVLSPGPTVRRLRTKLRDFSDDDFLLLIGDPVAIGLATALAAKANNDRVAFLKWDKQNAIYYIVRSDISGRPKEAL